MTKIVTVEYVCKGGFDCFYVGLDFWIRWTFWWPVWFCSVSCIIIYADAPRISVVHFEQLV